MRAAMSKHHQYHPSQTGNLHSPKKSHHDTTNTSSTSSSAHHGHPSNGFRTSTTSQLPLMGAFEHASQPNDTNNNYNKHRGHKRSSAEPNSNTNSSKKSKLSVPSDKGGKGDGGESDERASQNHYNIMEKLKELYKELKSDKSCKEVSTSAHCTKKRWTRKNEVDGRKKKCVTFFSPLFARFGQSFSLTLIFSGDLMENPFSAQSVAIVVPAR